MKLKTNKNLEYFQKVSTFYKKRKLKEMKIKFQKIIMQDLEHSYLKDKLLISQEENYSLNPKRKHHKNKEKLNLLIRDH